MLELLLLMAGAKDLDMLNSKTKAELEKHLILLGNHLMEESSELMLQVSSKRKKITNSEIEKLRRKKKECDTELNDDFK